MASLFAFHLNYVPVHLATTTHLGGCSDSDAGIVPHHHGHHTHDEDAHDPGHHIPHPASDHNLDLTAQTRAPVVALAVLFVLADISLLPFAPETHAALPLIERLKPPGETPPDPLQPRAPPLA